VLLRHKANLLVESAPDVGSKFCAQFPVSAAVTES
jgi:hypothetical protein